jgi:hypothetical protein
MRHQNYLLSLLLLASGVTTFIVIVLFLLATAVSIANIANAQDPGPHSQHSHPPEDLSSHELLYSKWIRPDKPENGSCCNNHDCYPAELKQENGTWYAKQRETQKWVEIPPEKFEHNRAGGPAFESPDGRNHVCIHREGIVYCAMLGGGV